MRRRRQLSSRILVSVVAILLASTLVGFALVTLQPARRVRARLPAAGTGGRTDIRGDAVDPRGAASDAARPTGSLIQSLAQQVRHETGATYIVVIDRNRRALLAPQPGADRPARSPSR